MQVKGIPTTIALDSGKTLKNVKPQGTDKPISGNIYLLSQHDAEHLFLTEEPHIDMAAKVDCQKEREAGPLRTIAKGKAKVAEAPSEADWQQAAVYRIALPSEAYDGKQMLAIDYQGDCARLYADGKLVADNFQYGRTFLYGLWRLHKRPAQLELRILPLQADMPVYLPREADRTPGERVVSVRLRQR